MDNVNEIAKRFGALSDGEKLSLETKDVFNDIIISKFKLSGDLLWVCQYGGDADGRNPPHRLSERQQQKQ